MPKGRWRDKINDKDKIPILVNSKQVYEHALTQWDNIEFKTGIENYPRQQADLIINLLVNEIKGRLRNG